jgi:hypothetical protein
MTIMGNYWCRFIEDKDHIRLGKIQVAPHIFAKLKVNGNKQINLYYLRTIK